MNVEAVVRKYLSEFEDAYDDHTRSAREARPDSDERLEHLEAQSDRLNAIDLLREILREAEREGRRPLPVTQGDWFAKLVTFDALEAAFRSGIEHARCCPSDEVFRSVTVQAAKALNVPVPEGVS